MSGTRPAAAEAGGDLPAGPGARVLSWWQSSLRLRVIVSTLVLGTVLTGLIGTLLYQRVAAGLVEQAVANAQVDAGQRVALAQDNFDSNDQRDDFGLSAAAQATVALITPGGQGARGMALLVQALDNEGSTLIPPYARGDISVATIPQELREALAAAPDLQQVFVTSLDRPGGPTGAPVVMVASRVQIPRAGAHDLVLLYTMDREQEILDLVRQWFLVGGILLLGLIGGVAWLATRLVTEPVGRAARVSQELARGELDERLPVHGSDELARLAMSFNTMADSLQQQIQRLQDLSQVQQRFVSDVSHELRTPLTTIRMAGEVLHTSRGDFTAPVARSAELLHGELDRFESLLEELLEISRYDSGTMELETQRSDLLGVTRDVVAAAAPLAERAGSTVTVHADTARVMVAMDARRVARILRNLVVNAIEHGEGRPITVDLVRTPTEVVVTVRDQGVGLHPDQYERVFERFWRADPARARTTGGTGLGLAIAREDARLHGGVLEASGVPGGGAQFRLVLPGAEESDPGTPTRERSDVR